MTGRTNRQSNIELLRIFAALGVVLLHYNNPSIGGGFDAVENGSLNQFVMVLFEAACICAVNLFVLISGYFMKNASRSDLMKPVKLLSMYVVFELAAFMIKELPNDTPLTMSSFFSYFTPSYWFLFVYIALYLVSPYINAMWSHLNLKSKKTLLIILLGIFSIYPIIWETITFLSGSGIWGEDKISFYGISQGVSSIGLFGSGGGYTIVNFVLMYLIGCYIKEKEENGVDLRGTGKIILFLLFNVLVIIGWTYAEFAVSDAPINATTGWNYENPFVISEAVLVFLFFKSLKIRNSKLINTLAAASFPTYLIHINILEYFRIADFVRLKTFFLILHIMGSIIMIYLICFAIFMFYDLITKPLFEMISKKWKKKRFIVVNDNK